MDPTFGINHLGLNPGFAKLTCQASRLEHMKSLISGFFQPIKMAVSHSLTNAPSLLIQSPVCEMWIITSFSRLLQGLNKAGRQLSLVIGVWPGTRKRFEFGCVT